MELIILAFVINFSLKLIGIKTLYLIVSTFIFGAIMSFISIITPREYHDIYEHGIKNDYPTIRINHPHPLDKHIMDIFFIPVGGFIGLSFAYCIILSGAVH